MVALALVALTGGLPSGAAAQDPGADPVEVRTYTVQPGDSIWSIAEEFYGSGAEYKIIYKYNKFIGKPPFLLTPGQVLRLPVGDKLPEAQVEWLKHKVKAKPPRSLDWLKARRRMNLWKLYKVSTGDESAVHIVFEDESDLRLRDNALLVIYGGSSNKTQTKRVGSRLVLEKGTIRGGLAKLDEAASPMRVDTPSGTVELYSRMAQIQAAAGASMISVYDGKAKVAARGASVEVPEGMGTVVKKGKRPQKPRPLPAVPSWSIEGAGAAVALVPPGGKATFEAAWGAVKRAKSYRVELAQDAAFKRTLYDIEVAGAVTRVRLKEIGPGSYFARIAAIDRRRLEGRPSAPLRVEVVAISSSRALTPAAEGVFEVVGFTRLSLSKEAAPGLEWRLDQGPFIEGGEPLRVSEPGNHEIRVRHKNETVETPFKLKVLAIGAAFEAPPAPLSPGATPTEVLLSITDERGRPALLPGVTVTAEPGGPLPLEDRGAGRYLLHASVPERARAEELTLRASWPGGDLGHHTLAVVPPPKPHPFEYRWPASRQGLRWDRRAQATTFLSATPVEHLGAYASVIAEGEGGPTVFGLTLAGELAPQGGRLGLDMALTLFRLSVESESSQGNKLGDFTLGARYLFIDDDALALGASLRARVPLGERSYEGRLVGVEPGLLLSWRLGEGLSFDTRQALVVASDLGAESWVTYSGDYALALRLDEVISLFAELDTALGLSRPEGSEAIGALATGGGLLLYLSRVRLGVSFGVGLGDEGRAHFGELYGGVTLDLGYGGPEAAP